ncbi:MAG TPA: Fic family protein [Candidatus Methanoperedenaceae archaeon]|nr:Fic family protein [Candidatus Methanoperedenaceae archaeon]
MSRSGTFVRQPDGYEAFVPSPLPPDPPIEYSAELRSLLSRADRELARLDGITTVLPNPELFIAMYVKKEAILSSQIEGTQASLAGILEFEAAMTPREDVNEIKEVINYIKALNHGMHRLDELSLSVELLRELHRTLLEGTRGARKIPGEFRGIQNYIGAPGATMREATFVPPPPDKVAPAMEELESFISSDDDIPPLVKIALIHAQFETIHPFLDGNGRVGRLLITLYLFWRAVLTRPILYLSFYLKKNRSEYYDLLMKVRREGAWEDWIKFFLRGVGETSQEAANTAREIIRLKDELVARLYENSVSSIHAVRLLDLLFETPVISTGEVGNKLHVSGVTANELVRRFVKIGILREVTGKQRYKKYMFRDYVDLIGRGTEG